MRLQRANKRPGPRSGRSAPSSGTGRSVPSSLPRSVPFSMPIDSSESSLVSIPAATGAWRSAG